MTAALLAEALAASFSRQEVLLLAAVLLASFVLEDAAVWRPRCWRHRA